jgi:pyridoxamine 5'-phosphate oxidase
VKKDTAGLELEQLGSDPIAAFRAWFDHALKKKVPMPEAMALATATPDGVPSNRFVLLRGVDDSGGFTFFTNYDSRKADELSDNPQAALAFHWHALDRQVRVEGAVTRLAAADNDAYWATRSLGSRIAAAVSRQSTPAPERVEMAAAYERLEKALAARPAGERDLKRPAGWGGYRLWPQAIEFWQGRPNRFHDRFRYERAVGGTWSVLRLWP